MGQHTRLNKHNERKTGETHQNSRTRFGQNEAAALENQRVSVTNLSLWDGCENRKSVAIQFEKGKFIFSDDSSVS